MRGGLNINNNMTKKDIEQLSVIYEQLSLVDPPSEGLLNELDQSTMNSAVMKHQEIKDRNRVARTRSDKFSIKHGQRASKDGKSIRVTSANGNNYIYYIQSAKKLDDKTIMIGALKRPVQIDSKFEKAVLSYNLTDDTLRDSMIMGMPEYDAPTFSDKTILQLVFKDDAVNLAKSIKQYTGINIPWKNMRFSI